MAISMGIKTVTSTLEERTWRTEVFTEKGQDPVVRGHRELVGIDPAGNVDSRDRSIPPVEFTLSSVLTETITLADGTVLTGAKMGEAISVWIDKKRQQVIDAPSQPVE
jgi:hypothetical protein